MSTFSNDTQAVLLLCGVLPGEKVAEHSPLTSSEFYALARWLTSLSATPAALLDSIEDAQMSDGFSQHQLRPERIRALLDRGMPVAVATEQWTQMGLWITSVYDENYPARLRERLSEKSSPLLFGTGTRDLFDREGLAIVGSRHADERALDFARTAGERCAQSNMIVVSGGARGIDLTAMQGALDVGGEAVGVVASDLAKLAVSPDVRPHLQAGTLALLSPFSPHAPFHAGNAMARNKYIYALADHALVISSDHETGGTWSGAVENLKYHWCPLFVRDETEIPEGNRRLLKRGARSFPREAVANAEDFRDFWLRQIDTESPSEQTSLFGSDGGAK